MSKILFFIKGMVPTSEDLEQASKIGTKSFRNIQYTTPEQPMEECAGVAGCAPSYYRAKFPYVELPQEPKPVTNPAPEVKPTEEPSISLTVPPDVKPAEIKSTAVSVPPWLKT